ncbi:MAG TPA: hypothetical protein VGD40_15885 [Chryseosolibacter sp.]
MYRLIASLILGSTVAFAQVKVSPHSKLMFSTNSLGFVSELPRAAPGTVGTTYYEERWLVADLFLKGETKLEGVKVKLDLSTHNFELLHGDVVKLLPGDKVLSFQWVTSEGNQEAFVRGNYITSEGLKVNGFLKLISDTEPYQLLQFFTTETISANYNPQLDVGNKDHQIVKKSRTFVAKDKLLVEVRGNKKKFLHDFKETFQTDVSQIVREFDIDPRDEEELIVLLKQLNYSKPG